MQNMKLRPDWAAIKAEYLAGNGSFRVLAHRYNVSCHTLSKRAKREGCTWEMAKLCDAVATTAMETATQRGKELGMTSADFVERSIRETERWLNRIEAPASDGKLTPETAQKLVSSWRATLAAGREAFNLDSRAEQTVNFGAVMLDAFYPKAIEAEVCEANTGG